MPNPENCRIPEYGDTEYAAPRSWTDRAAQLSRVTQLTLLDENTIVAPVSKKTLSDLEKYVLIFDGLNGLFGVVELQNLSHSSLTEVWSAERVKRPSPMQAAKFHESLRIRSEQQSDIPTELLKKVTITINQQLREDRIRSNALSLEVHAAETSFEQSSGISQFP